MRKQIAGIVLCIGLSAELSMAQAPVRLTLQDAKTMVGIMLVAQKVET